MSIKAKILSFDIASFGIGGGGVVLGISQINNLLVSTGGVILIGLQIYHVCVRIKKEKKTP